MPVFTVSFTLDNYRTMQWFEVLRNVWAVSVSLNGTDCTHSPLDKMPVCCRLTLQQAWCSFTPGWNLKYDYLYHSRGITAQKDVTFLFLRERDKEGGKEREGKGGVGVEE